jgi:hypothetical protein
MATRSDESAPTVHKRRFAAKFQHLGWGIALGITGAGVASFNLLMALVGAFTAETSGDVAFYIVFFGAFVAMGLGLVALAVFLLRGPAVVELAAGNTHSGALLTQALAGAAGSAAAWSSAPELVPPTPSAATDGRGSGPSAAVGGSVAVIAAVALLTPAMARRQAREFRRQASRDAKQLKVAQRQAAESQRREAVARQKAEEETRLAALRAEELSQSAAALAGVTGGAAIVAYRNLEATAKRLYPQGSEERLSSALTSIDFDIAVISSPRFGCLKVLAREDVEVFRDYIVCGQTAHDVDETTRGQVYTDGAVQVSQRAVIGKGGQVSSVTERHDLRSAHIQFTSTSWALQLPIQPDDVPAARQYVEQLAAHVETLKPRHASATDMREMVEAILNNTGQPPAEKLRQLSNLRYEHLLTDTEFLKAKEKILGI